jgi:hypothetical protein
MKGAQLLSYVHVTEVLPPHAGGALVALFAMIPLHPPPAFVVSSQSIKAASIASCVWHGACVWSSAQTNSISGACSTVNVLVHSVMKGGQLFSYVHVTSTLPPQAGGAAVPS